ncbi:hypothetical protein BV20DRAFT_967462 [Pilatotrama ljubarskyi]|nr:hypothetical protein BV20DRAFT_967462 [Pilatotrama ljubarskyi]
MASGTQRQPDAVYKDHNGFTERVILKMSGAVPPAKCNLHAVAAHPENASPEDLRELRDAIQRRQFVEDVMELRGTFFPGLEAIKKENEKHETSATIKERIQEKQKRHIEEISTLYQWQAQDYHDEMLDLSQSKADIDDPAVEAYYKTTRSNFEMATSFDNDLDRLNYAHLTSLIPLVKERQVYRLREEAEQRRRDQLFPASISDFRAIRNKDTQLRVARFLTSNDAVRERMMDEFSWVWRQVTPLVHEYDRTESFKAEVQTLLRDMEVQDPRKARRESQNTVAS